MYTTKEFERAVNRQGYELEHVYYTERQTLLKACGYAVKAGRKIRIKWDARGKAFLSRGLSSEFDLKIEKHG
jgi:hypothetical protein